MWSCIQWRTNGSWLRVGCYITHHSGGYDSGDGFIPNSIFSQVVTRKGGHISLLPKPLCSWATILTQRLGRRSSAARCCVASKRRPHSGGKSEDSACWCCRVAASVSELIWSLRVSLLTADKSTGRKINAPWRRWPGLHLIRVDQQYSSDSPAKKIQQIKKINT